MEKTADQMLDAFATGPFDPGNDQAAQALLKGKLVSKHSNDPRMLEGLRTRLSSSKSPREARVALALAYRFGAAARRLQGEIRAIARPLLDRVPEEHEQLADGDDRYYLALAVNDADRESVWLVDYLAKAIALEETAENARAVLTKRLLKAVSISEAFAKVASALESLPFETKKPEEARAKRLKRVLAAFRVVLVRELCVPGASLGQSMRSLFRKPFGQSGLPPAGKVLDSLADEACALVYDVLRTQLTVIADTTVYGSLSPFSQHYSAVMWARMVRKSDHAQRVVQTCESALILLASQGISDANMLAALVSLTGSRENAAERAARLAADHPGLQPDIREWLSRFGSATTATRLGSFETSHERSADELIAALMADAVAAVDRVRKGLDQPQAAFENLRVGIEHVASARQLKLRHEIGQAVDFLPGAHELVGGESTGVRKVRVLRPLVERIGPSGPQLVVKAIVERC